MQRARGSQRRNSAVTNFSTTAGGGKFQIARALRFPTVLSLPFSLHALGVVDSQVSIRQSFVKF